MWNKWVKQKGIMGVVIVKSKKEIFHECHI